MTIHLCRDIQLGGALGGLTSSYDSMWTVMVFLQGALGYKFSSSAGNPTLIPPAYADTVVPYYSATQTGPNSWTFAQHSSSILNLTNGSCFINLGADKENFVQFSTDVLNLSAAAYPIGYPDISGAFPAGTNFWLYKWLCLKSNEFPLANSGIFLITSASFSDNAVVIDYRASTGSYPMQQTSSLATASLWLPPPGSDTFNYGRTADTWGAWNTMTDNGLGLNRYSTSGSGATFPRVILDSPSPLGWQLRLCIEATPDRLNFHDPALSMIPGYGGTNGDFPEGKFLTTSSLHLHVNAWHNTSSIWTSYTASPGQSGIRPGLDRYRVNAPRIWETGVNARFRGRLYIWGDDETGNCAIFLRNQENIENCFMIFGQAEDPPVPSHGDHPVHQLFAVGNTYGNVSDIDWRSGEYNYLGVGGCAYSLDKRLGPISCVMAPLMSIAFASNEWSTFDAPWMFDLRATSSSFAGGARELIPVDLYAGTWDNAYIVAHPPNLSYEPRRLGYVPIARMGCATGQAEWATADDDKTWFHVKNGFYLPWGGVTPLA